MNFPFYQVDAFTRELFGGNPAGVMILREWLPDATMQRIAAENNLAETAFVIPRRDVSPLRWFTPELEIDLCGHATLGAAAVILKHILPELDRLTFRTVRSGDLTVDRDGDRLRLDFPARPGRPAAASPALTALLGRPPAEVLMARDLMVVLPSEADVRAFQPDAARISALDVFGMILTAPGDQVDFVSRFFAPAAGILEDPVTGSAHCTLVPYWAERLGRTKLLARQISPRGGELHCELAGDRVRMSGHAVEYLRGEIDLPEACL